MQPGGLAPAGFVLKVPSPDAEQPARLPTPRPAPWAVSDGNACAMSTSQRSHFPTPVGNTNFESSKSAGLMFAGAVDFDLHSFNKRRRKPTKDNKNTNDVIVECSSEELGNKSVDRHKYTGAPGAPPAGSQRSLGGLAAAFSESGACADAGRLAGLLSSMELATRKEAEVKRVAREANVVAYEQVAQMESARSRKARSASAQLSTIRNADPQRSDPGAVTLDPPRRTILNVGKKDIRVGALPCTYRTVEEDEEAELEKRRSHRQILQRGLSEQVALNEQRRNQVVLERTRHAKHVQEDTELWNQAKDLQKGILSARAHLECRALDGQIAEKHLKKVAQTARNAIEEGQTPPVLLCGQPDPPPDHKHKVRAHLAEMRKADLLASQHKKALSADAEAKESARTSKLWTAKLKEQAAKSYRDRQQHLEDQVNFASIGERTGLPLPKWTPEEEESRIATQIREQREREVARERRNTQLKQQARNEMGSENDAQLKAHRVARQSIYSEHARDLAWIQEGKEVDTARRDTQIKYMQKKAEAYGRDLEEQIVQRERLRAAGGGVLHPTRPLTERSTL